MSALAILAALVIEQWRPLAERGHLQGTLGALAQWLEQSFNGGERRQGSRKGKESEPENNCK